MSDAAPVPTAPISLDDWIARDAIPFAEDAPDSFNGAVDRLVGELGGSVELLGFGEALHGDEGVLLFRNHLFQRLVQAHGYTAIAVESSFPRGRLVNDYVAGRGGATSYDAIQESGFSHTFGRSDANRQLVEWMRQRNAAAAPGARPLRFYGFDSPTEMSHADSPRDLLHVALDGLAIVDPAGAAERRGRMEALLGDDADWANPAATMDPSKSVGLSPAAAALRVETEDLITALGLRRPDWPGGDMDGFVEALQHATVARQLLSYHAALARPSPDRVAHLLGIRDLIMADNLAYIAARERARAGLAGRGDGGGSGGKGDGIGAAGSRGGREGDGSSGGGASGGKVLAFAHNSHLKRGQTRWETHWPQGPDVLTWWPAGAHVAAILGPRYAVLGSAVATSEPHGIAAPEPGTLESRLAASPGPRRFIPTRRGTPRAPATPADLPTRSASTKNYSYFPLTPQSLGDFDALVL